ncbi:MAG: DUF3035 domain-containing protein [Caulobacteraceae bacterium]|nr:DUF3035 domain-containing protein [Caulobacteraceae bacterium]
MSFNRVAAVAVLTAGLGLAGLGLTGCNSTKEALGITKVTPDEFRVVTIAPLVVPPDYSLRPPAPGEPRPQELQPESQARQALLGAPAAEGRSEGEKLLDEKAGGDKADPLIRYVVDDEFGAIAHKDPSFADRVMFWRKPQAAAAGAETAGQSGAATPAPIDPKVEAERVQKLTGGQAVVIQREAAESHIKLPGL